MARQQVLTEETAVQFYEDRYRQGYMEDWPEEKKRRISEVIRELPIPSTGDCLDFGCGNGVFTGVLRRALPDDWNVYGSDISSTAVENAREQFPDCRFCLPDDPELTERKFDLIFTHHVLEHVLDLASIFAVMDGLLKERAAMMHILPCGNPGSLEHQLASWRHGGIDASAGNRFFYEDEGHVRRLTTDELAAELQEHGFELSREYYGNQHHGGVEWMTRYGAEVVNEIADASQAVDDQAAGSIQSVRETLLGLQRRRQLARDYRERLTKPSKTWKNYAYLLLRSPEFAMARRADELCRKRSEEEWQTRRTDRGGSEMYVFFQREASPNS